MPTCRFRPARQRGGTTIAHPTSPLRPGAARRALPLAVAVLAAVGLSACGSHHRSAHHHGGSTTVPSAPTPAAPAPAPSGGSPTQPPGSLSVVSYGADPTGGRDSGQAFQQAVTAAETGSSDTVYVPAGRYVFTGRGSGAAVTISTRAVHVIGAGAAATTIVEEVGAKSGAKLGKVIFSIKSGKHNTPGGGDGSSIAGLTLDSASYDAGTAILDTGNDTTLSGLVVHAPRSSQGYNGDQFGIRVIAICNHDDLARVHRSGNRVADVVLTGEGQGGNTDLDISCQEGTTVSDVNDTGNGIDIYICDNVTVDGLTFHPGPQRDPTPYVITPPSDHITLLHVTSYGNGGRIQPSPKGYKVTNTTISGEQMLDRTQTLVLGDAQSTTITSSSLGHLDLAPVHGLAGVDVQGSSVAAVTCSGAVSGVVGASCGA